MATHPFRPLLAVAAALLAIPAGEVLAAESLRSLGDSGVLHGTLGIDGKQIPMPDGDWRLAGRAEFTPTGWPATETVTSLSLLRLRGNAVDAAVLVQLANPGADTSWGKAPGCERTDLPVARVRYASDHDGSCAWVASVVRDDTGSADPAWQRSLDEAARRGWSVPASWVMAGFRVTDPRDAIQVRYAFDDGRRAAQTIPAETPRLPPRLPDAAWVEAAWDQVELGLRNRLSPAATIPDWSARRTLPPALAEGEAAGGLGRTVWKTMTFRSVVTTLDFSSNYIALGDAAAAAGLSAFGFVIGPFVYIGHELAWEKFGGSTTQPIALPGIGAETAGAS